MVRFHYLKRSASTVQRAREIAKAAGVSIGTLYEYIKIKEDVLYLIWDRIYDQVRDRLKENICLKQS
jgi:AcrR family transcriptional regulator